MSIRVLDASVAALIAAGEVVERPASVVKELVENAIDAGATHIEVEIATGGRSLIRVTDDGCGMTPEDALTAFSKHATSKIFAKDDLFCIKTLGFRGEALPSISAVSRVTLLTKTKEQSVGTRVVADAGMTPVAEEAPAANGTTVTVKDLFFNTPARYKFLKSEASEAGAIFDYVQKLALSRPELSFSLRNNGQDTLFTPGGGQLSEAVFSLFGKDFLEGLLPVEKTTDDIHVHGYICKPVCGRSNRRYQFFFVNGRIVQSKLLSNVLENAYRNSMLVSHFPYAVLFIDINPSDVDINVHPGKLEVKFADEPSVSLAVSAAVNRPLTAEQGVDEIRLPQSDCEALGISAHVSEKKPETDVPTYKKTETFGDWVVVSDEPVKVREHSDAAVSLSDLSDFLDRPLPELHDSVQIFTPAPQPKTEPQPVVCQEEPKLEEVEALDDFTVVGEVFNAYIVVEKGDEVLFVDKHALHERMNFEDLKTKPVPTQLLLVPQILSFGGEDKALLLENADVLAKAGFSFDDFGNALAVREIPQILTADRVESVFSDAVEALRSGRGRIDPLDEIYHSVACKAAIKSGWDTSRQEEIDLISRYFKHKDTLKYCPHGRPIAFSLSRAAMEKEFKRIV